MKILGIETSCDETAAAIVEDGKTILSSVVASSAEMFRKYGGIVPEVAAREQVKVIVPTINEAFAQAKLKPNDIDAIAVTVGPGLIGSLLIGVEAAKTLALVLHKPIIPVNHVIAHMYANFVNKPYHPSPLSKGRLGGVLFPAISLVVSGGHTELYLMKNEREITWLGGTFDDAAGEAFDKGARLLGFENRGGPAIAQAAREYKIENSELKIKLPRPMMDDSLNFSFSGLKTALLREVTKLKETNQWDPDTIQQLAHELQEAITDVLVRKTLRAAQIHKAKSIVISGGVSANERLREKFIQSTNYPFFSPQINLCTDNAVTIATYAYFQNQPVDWHKITAQPDLPVEVCNIATKKGA